MNWKFFKNLTLIFNGVSVQNMKCRWGVVTHFKSSLITIQMVKCLKMVIFTNFTLCWPPWTAAAKSDNSLWSIRLIKTPLVELGWGHHQIMRTWYWKIVGVLSLWNFTKKYNSQMLKKIKFKIMFRETRYFEGCWSNKVKSMIERSEWQKSKLQWWSKMNHQQRGQGVILHKHTQRDLEAGLVSKRSRVKGVFGFYGYELWLAWVQLMTPFSSIYLAKWVYIS